jgi:hypothetical protein
MGLLLIIVIFTSAFWRRLSWLSAGILRRRRVRYNWRHPDRAVDFVPVRRAADGLVLLLALSSTTPDPSIDSGCEFTGSMSRRRGDIYDPCQTKLDL